MSTTCDSSVGQALRARVMDQRRPSLVAAAALGGLWTHEGELEESFDQMATGLTSGNVGLVR